MGKKDCCDYYDDPEFDYRDYWVGREYEDQVERQILGVIFEKIGRQDVLVDVGGGFGRLVSEYMPWVNKGILLEPAKKNLDEAKGELQNWRNLSLKQGTVENTGLKKGSVDCVMMVRVAHHCISVEKAFKEICRVLKPGGWFVLEFPNKIHALMTMRMWLKGDFEYRKDLSSIDRRALVNQAEGTIHFMNHHPEEVEKYLRKSGFEVEKWWSVSNFRRLKFIPLKLALWLDRLLWGLVRPVWWGPSIFVLAHKRK